MWDWLISPIDPNRAHEVGFAVSWHARLMIVAWGFAAPLLVLIARFFKVMPGQDWPRQLDNQTWWRAHWMGQSLVVATSFFAMLLVVPRSGGMSLHNWLGYGVLLGVLGQITFGYFRGNKGGPTAPAPDGSLRGDHYDMTPWRRMFEAVHKTLGYTVLVVAAITILLGLWKANAPVWMWLAVSFWWPLLIVVFVVLQRRGMAIDTYQAIWGNDPTHPGNQGKKPGWGMRRPKDRTQGEKDVRNDRGYRVRSH